MFRKLFTLFLVVNGSKYLFSKNPTATCLAVSGPRDRNIQFGKSCNRINFAQNSVEIPLEVPILYSFQLNEKYYSLRSIKLPENDRKFDVYFKYKANDDSDLSVTYACQEGIKPFHVTGNDICVMSTSHPNLIQYVKSAGVKEINNLRSQIYFDELEVKKHQIRYDKFRSDCELASKKTKILYDLYSPVVTSWLYRIFFLMTALNPVLKHIQYYFSGIIVIPSFYPQVYKFLTVFILYHSIGIFMGILHAVANINMPRYLALLIRIILAISLVYFFMK